MTDVRMRPSEVFAKRLRETRNARGSMSQTELACRMTQVGRPMSKAALLRIENNERGLSLDEALAFPAVLNAVPAGLLTPPDGATLQLTDTMGVDGAGLRAWLLYGFEFLATAGDYQRGEREKALGRSILRLAQALVDADRGGDKAGFAQALKAIAQTGIAYQEFEKQAERGETGFQILTDEDEGGEK